MSGGGGRISRESEGRLNYQMKTQIHCRDCVYFNRWKWHQTIDRNEENQMGGDCDVLLKILQKTNSSLWAKEKLHIHDSFGCVLGKAKKEGEISQ